MISVDRFVKWLKDQGAEILPSDQFQLLKYRWAGQVSIVYRNSKGRLRWYNQTADHYFAFKQQKTMSIARNGTGKIKSARKPQIREALIARDGDNCWLCNARMQFECEDTQHPRAATIEHLWSKSRGGPNFIENLVLCCFECNQVLDERPLIEKLKIRDWVRMYLATYVSTSGVKYQPVIDALKERLENAPDGII